MIFLEHFKYDVSSHTYLDLVKHSQMHQADRVSRKCAGIDSCKEERSLHDDFFQWETNHTLLVPARP